MSGLYEVDTWLNSKFGRYNTETGELDFCLCLDDNGCEWKDEDTSDDGSKLENGAESIDNSNEDEKDHEEEPTSEDQCKYSG
ncbi:hypothetical protein BOTNAR_0457g00010 [Botryotinia narcissicola]|uniref:Uncharacterized protein n=1 Tax=Botryotinia narcissicola TaxID=278944 RepID=A0A4Z1HV44_9HELO|nr:hypothetical protein BOTNAR_0457g00010 [Botryotinia narcissicola]